MKRKIFIIAIVLFIVLLLILIGINSSNPINVDENGWIEKWY